MDWHKLAKPLGDPRNEEEALVVSVFVALGILTAGDGPVAEAARATGRLFEDTMAPAIGPEAWARLADGAMGYADRLDADGKRAQN